jgi:hypothetical protein
MIIIVYRVKYDCCAMHTIYANIVMNSHYHNKIMHALH